MFGNVLHKMMKMISQSMTHGNIYQNNETAGHRASAPKPKFGDKEAEKVP